MSAVGSSDAGALYSNGSMYCHKCQKPFDMDGEIPLFQHFEANAIHPNQR